MFIPIWQLFDGGTPYHAQYNNPVHGACTAVRGRRWAALNECCEWSKIGIVTSLIFVLRTRLFLCQPLQSEPSYLFPPPISFPVYNQPRREARRASHQNGRTLHAQNHPLASCHSACLQQGSSDTYQALGAAGRKASFTYCTPVSRETNSHCICTAQSNYNRLQLSNAKFGSKIERYHHRPVIDCCLPNTVHNFSRCLLLHASKIFAKILQ
jgi:hypothetical protein